MFEDIAQADAETTQETAPEATSAEEASPHLLDPNGAEPTREAFQELSRAVRVDAALCKQLGERARTADAASLGNDASLRTGGCLWAACAYEEAADALAQAPRSAVAKFLRARSLMRSGQPGEARSLLKSLVSSDAADNDAQAALLETLDAEGNADVLAKGLTGLPAAFRKTTDYVYFSGRLAEHEGRTEEAMESYENALELDGDHSLALFRLSFLLYLHGMDEEAATLLERLVRHVPVDTSALMNLGIIYEDREDYTQAAECFEAVLEAHPSDDRARLYLDDARASQTMHYDEDQERRLGRLQQTLRTPISDFELSVRARNCLDKMGIATLGDLVGRTTTELLAFKNFGETSLQEIEEILTMKGLHLGMSTDLRSVVATGDTESEPDMGLPLASLDLSVRSRRAVDTLDLGTVGELCERTEAELLDLPNFGETSLNEIKSQLARRGLSLKS